MGKIDRWLDDNFGKVILLAVLGLCIFMVLFTREMNYMSLPVRLAEIESLRKDVQSVFGRNSEGISKLAAEANMEIENMKTRRKLYSSMRFMTPPGWDEVKPIELNK